MLNPRILILLVLTALSIGTASGAVIYEENFEAADLATAGWTGTGNTFDNTPGLPSPDALFVFQSGASNAVTTTNEFSFSPDNFNDITFTWDQQHHSFSISPTVSLAVESGGQWYVSTATFTTATTGPGPNYESKSVVFDPTAANWDLLDLITPARGITAPADLSGAITGVGFFNVTTVSSTSHFDGMTITGNPVPEPSTITLYLVGLLSIGFVGWRRRRR